MDGRGDKAERKEAERKELLESCLARPDREAQREAIFY